MEKLKLYTKNELKNNKELFVMKNAFIKPDGTFYLTKGYTGCNPWHQLESSALWVGRKDIGVDFVEQYENYLQHLKQNMVRYQEHIAVLRELSRVEGATQLYDKRSILVRYYGYVLFCRTEFIKTFNDRGYFTDMSMIPNPKFYKNEATLKQKETLETLFAINERQKVGGFTFTQRFKTEEGMLKLVYEHEHSNRDWHI